MADDRHRITLLLDRWRKGEAEALDELFPMIYSELHSRAEAAFRRESSGHTLQPTAIVHELYLKLKDQNEVPKDRQHFFATAAILMRRILIDCSRKRKHRGADERITLSDDLSLHKKDATLEAVVDALEALAKEFPRPHEVVTLRYLGGLSHEQIAEMLGCSYKTVQRDWKLAKGYLHRLLNANGE